MHLRRTLFFAILLIMSLSARADSFNFQFSGPSDSGSGMFTADATANPGEYIVTGITGTMNRKSIAALIPPNLYPPDVPNDNSFFFPADAVTTYFDDCGVSFVLSDGTDVNLYYGTYTTAAGVLGPGYILVEGVDEVPSTLTTLNISAAASVTPEPPSLALLATAIIGLFSAAGFRRAARPESSSEAMRSVQH